MSLKRLPNFIVLAYLEVPKAAKPGPTDRQNWRLLYVTWLTPSAIKTHTLTSPRVLSVTSIKNSARDPFWSLLKQGWIPIQNQIFID